MCIRRRRRSNSPSTVARRALALALGLVALLVTQIGFEREARADIISFWGQLHGGYLTGTSDRFDEGSQPFFGFAAGLSITVVDIFTDVRLDGFDLDNAGMWNQIGAGVSFGIPLYEADEGDAEELDFEDEDEGGGSVGFSTLDLVLGVRVAYLYAQFNEEARQAFEEKFEAGDREEEPSQKGLNFSAQAALELELIWPIYLNVMTDVGYHVLLPAVQDDHGINFSALGGLKVKVGF